MTVRTLAGLELPVLTTTQRDALSAGEAPKGTAIFNSTTGQIEVNKGTGASPVWGSASGGDQGNTLPTSNLYNGLRYVLDYNDGVDYHEWQFVYRADLDATNPWIFVGGVPLLKGPGSASFGDNGTNRTATALTFTMPSLPGIWWFEPRWANITGSQTNAQGCNVLFSGTGSIGTIMQPSSASATPAGGHTQGPNIVRKVVAGGETVTAVLAGHPDGGESHSCNGIEVVLTPFHLQG